MRGGIRLVCPLSIGCLWLVFTIGPLVTEAVGPQVYSPPSNSINPVIQSDNLVNMLIDSSCLGVYKGSVKNESCESISKTDIEESGEDVPFEERVQEDSPDTVDEKIGEEVNDEEYKDSSQSDDEESSESEDEDMVSVDDSSKGVYVIIYGDTTDDTDTSVDEESTDGSVEVETVAEEESQEETDGSSEENSGESDTEATDSTENTEDTETTDNTENDTDNAEDIGETGDTGATENTEEATENTENIEDTEGAEDTEGTEESGALEPIAYWNFDEGGGTTINDDTENGNTGRLNIYPWTKGVTGELTDSCVSFDGSNYIEVEKSEDLDITGPFTVTLWIRPHDLSVDNDSDDSPDVQTIIHGGTCTWGLQIDSGYWLSFYTDTRPDATDSDFESPYAWLSSVWSIEEDRWTFVAIVYDGSYMYLYTLPEGETESHVSSRAQGGDIRTSESPIYIGSLNSSWEQAFYGCLDEVNIYNSALTWEEIIEEIEDNIILYYNFNEGNGIEINDITENGNTGYLNTDDYNPWVSESFENYIEFNGQVNIEIPKSEDLNITGQFTVTLWINPENISLDRDSDGSPDTQTIIHGGTCTWGLQIDSGYWLSFYTDTRLDATDSDFESPYAWLSSVWSIEEDRWTFVAIVYDGSNMYLYTLPEDETELHVSYRAQGGNIRTSESPIYIGSLNLSWEQPFYGCLDEVKIYNRALSEEEIEAGAGIE